jgi:hypothetical protein
MATSQSKRRQAHGSAWHWKQTDAWYYTPAGTRKRVPLFDEAGDRIRGKENTVNERSSAGPACTSTVKTTIVPDESKFQVSRVMMVLCSNGLS